MRRIKKQMCAHLHVRLGHGSKDTAHVRLDTSFCVSYTFILGLNDSTKMQLKTAITLQLVKIYIHKNYFNIL